MFYINYRERRGKINPLIVAKDPLIVARGVFFCHRRG
jgi:hypothetical protein